MFDIEKSASEELELVSDEVASSPTVAWRSYDDYHQGMKLRSCRMGWVVVWSFASLLGCQQPDERQTESFTQVRSALGPCTVDVQGIGEPYLGWVGLKTDGSVWMNRLGGDESTTTVAMKVEQLGNDVRSIANVDGESQTFCVVKTDDTLWCWGANTNGQVGDGSGQAGINDPTQIDLPGGNVDRAGTGGWHSCATTLDGRVFCWGQNLRGQIGDGQANGTADVLTPTQVTSLGDEVAEVSVGFEHTCALMKGGAISCWGHNPYGEIGDGTSHESNPGNGIKAEPIAIGSLGTDVAVLSAGGFFTCIIKKSDGSLWCWGANTDGHLGTGDTVNRKVPTPSAEAGPWRHVDTGVAHACGVKVDGSVWCWGRDLEGQLGTQSPVTQICPGTSQPCAPTPQPVEGISSGAERVSVKERGACALMTNGDLKCWGAGNFLDGGGQSHVPVLVDYCDLCEVSSCSGANPFCGWNGVCEPCSQDHQCPEATPACLPSGHCAECSPQNTSTCANTQTTLCNPDTNRCVECMTNEDCLETPTTPICDAESRACRACATDADCPANAPACRPNGLCSECSATNLTACVAPLSLCEPASGICVNCITDADCTDDDAAYCDTGINYCHQCLTNEHCTPQLPVCDHSGNYCSGCETDEDCPSTFPVCGDTGSCGECSAENMSLCTADRPYCDDQNQCVECLSHDDCNTEAGEFCDMSTMTCETDTENGEGGSGEGGEGAEDEGRYGACAGCATSKNEPRGWQIGLLLAAMLVVRRRR